MRTVKTINFVGTAVPFLFVLMGIFSSGFFFLAILSTMFTGLCQIIAGVCFWIKFPSSNLIKIYLIGVTIFFVLWWIQGSEAKYIFAMPVILFFYLTWIIYNHKTRTDENQ